MFISPFTPFSVFSVLMYLLPCIFDLLFFVLCFLYCISNADPFWTNPVTVIPSFSYLVYIISLLLYFIACFFVLMFCMLIVVFVQYYY